MTRVKVLYTAFDAYPGHKGAQAHIRSNLCAARENGYDATLLCLGGGGSFHDPESSAAVHACAANEQNLLKRSEEFGRFVSVKADGMTDDPPGIIHFRDIWSGIPLLSHRISRNSRLVFEVNGLPSVELPSRFPHLARNQSLLKRVRAMENECLDRSDAIITVSARTTRYLSGRGYGEKKISLIPNSVDPSLADSAADIPQDLQNVVSRPEKIILYTGTLASWQGVHTVIDALSHLRHRRDLLFLIIASNKRNVVRLKRRIASHGLSHRVIVHEGLPRRATVSLYKRAYACVAPLARGPRNESQGCCPLKIVEAMACGIPVVASDLPSIREIIDNGTDGMLAPPDSPRALAQILNRLMDDPAMRDRLALCAYEKARKVFMADLFSERLGTVYTSLLGGKGNAILNR